MISTVPLADAAYRRALDDGLLLRWSVASDLAQLGDLYAQVFRHAPDAPLNQHLPVWTRDLMSGRHPLITPGDFAVVEDTHDGALVAATCLLSHVWTYEGIDFAVGRPESVASREKYRNRGLVRAIFALIHARSAALGHLAQGITGISYYYRQFGYEYALDLGGYRTLPLSMVPRLDDGASEPFLLREATIGDLPVLAALYDRDRAAATVSARVDEAYWRWQLAGMDRESHERWASYIVVDAGGHARGYLLASRAAWRGALTIIAAGAAEGTPLARVLPSALRGLTHIIAQAPVQPDQRPTDRLTFDLCSSHPLYDALGDLLPPAHRPPYAWYVRVPELPTFLRHLAPTLERRLRESVVAGFSGDVPLDFYRGGLRLTFHDGRLTAAEEWRRGVWDQAQAGFPPGVFLQLLFGYRSFADLRYAFPDVWATEETGVLLAALFPPRRSWVVPLH